ncbi:adenosine deaminase/editase [Hypoxylon cercidicola]|nr:adenosine deaminase/editase [Hypoxylon cercidicola]
MKCLPASKIPQTQGNVLHDWHAEVLAIRALNRFVLDECKAMLQGCSSEFLRLRTSDEMTAGAEGGWNGQPFTWREDFRLHMYCSEAPCGDASMELIMASQEDATPWDTPPPLTTINAATTTPTTSLEPTLPGRAYFSQLGVVRRKPARSDAQPTLSKSCSDKLALKQCTSLLSSPAALLVDPRHVYLDTLVLPASRHSDSACRRAFSAEGRMLSLSREVEKGGCYAFRPFVVNTTTSEFAFSQRTTSLAAIEANRNDNEGNEQKTAAGVAPSNLAVAWTHSGLEETSLGGTLQGRKQFDPRGASFASRRKIWALAAEVANLVKQVDRDGEGNEGEDREVDCLVVADIRRALNADTYGEMKNSPLLQSRRAVKEKARSESLRGWARNAGDESFTL